MVTGESGRRSGVCSEPSLVIYKLATATAARGSNAANRLAALDFAALLFAALRSFAALLLAALRSLAALLLAALLLAAAVARRSGFATAGRGSSGTSRGSSGAGRGSSGTSRSSSRAARSAARGLAATAVVALLVLHAAGRLASGSTAAFAATATKEFERRGARRDTEQRNSNTHTSNTALHGKLLETKNTGRRKRKQRGTTCRRNRRPRVTQG